MRIRTGCWRLSRLVRLAGVRSLPAAVTLAAAAILQALGQFAYRADPIIVTGRVFFPVLFALMALYLGYRTRENARFGLGHAVLGVLGVVLLVLTVIGQTTANFAFYPQPYVYYGAFAGLALTVALCILAMPKKARTEESAGPAEEQEDLKPVVRGSRSRRRRPAGAGPTHLVARPKGNGEAASDEDAAESSEAESRSPRS